MADKKSKLLVPVVGTAVVVAAGVAAYTYFNGIHDATSPLASAKVVPHEALMAGFVSTDAKAWSKLQQFGTPETQSLIAKGIGEFNKKSFTKYNINYEKDLKPWLGSVTFAVLPSPTTQPAQHTPQSARSSNVLVVVGIKNKVSAYNFANKLKSQNKIKPKGTAYKGIEILESTERSRNTYLAVLDNQLVVSSERRPVELAIDTFKGQPSFASKQGAAKLFSKGVDLKNPIAQLYLPDYGSVAQQLILNNPNAPALSAEALNQLKNVSSMVMGVGVDDAGVRMQAIANINQSAVKMEYKPTPGKVVAQFPAETFALLGGQGISRFWSAVVEQSQSDPATQQTIDSARQQLKNSVNLDLDNDILGWMDGEFALAAISSNQGLVPPLGFGAALMLKTSDRPRAEATLNKLDAIAKGYSLTVAPRNVGGKLVTEWEIPLQGALLGHGWLDGETVFVAVGGRPIVDAIATQPSPSLDNSQTFKVVTGTLPKPNSGYFYLDMDKTMSLLNPYLLQTQNIPPEATALLDSIRGIGMTTTAPDKSTSKVEMLLALKPKSAK